MRPIITSIIGVIVALISALSGLKPQKAESEDEQKSVPSFRWEVNPLPLAFLMSGIILGSIIGIFARNQNWLGTNLRTEIQRWEAIGVDGKDVAKRLFDMHYPQNSSSEDADRITTTTVLRGENFEDETVQSLTNIGIEYEKQGKPNEAMVAFQEAISLASEPLNYLAWSYQKQGRFDDALPLAQVVVMMNPREAKFVDTLAVVLCQAGQHEEALHWMEKVVELDPTEKYKARLKRFRQGVCR